MPTFPSTPPMLLFCDVDSGVTPGVSVSSCVKFRPFNGRSCTVRSLMTLPSSEVDAWTNSLPAVISTTSVISPTDSERFCVRVSLTPRVKGFVRDFLNPFTSTISVYDAGLRLTKVKNPLCEVVTSLSVLVTWSISLTMAPGTAAPFGSLTVPLTSPVAVCACKAAAASNVNMMPMIMVLKEFMVPSSIWSAIDRMAALSSASKPRLASSEVESERRLHDAP